MKKRIIYKVMNDNIIMAKESKRGGIGVDIIISKNITSASNITDKFIKSKNLYSSDIHNLNKCVTI